MKARLGIKYPTVSKLVIGPGYFAAYGYGKETGTDISGVLLDANGNFIAKSERTIISDKLWILTFKPAPGAVLTTANYTLVVYDAATGAAAAVSPVQFGPGGLRRRDDAAIHIISPGNGDNVCEEFAAYGTTDHPQYDITCGVLLEPAPLVPPPAVVVTPDPDGTWVAALQAGASDTLTYSVQASDDDGGFSERDGITVSKCDNITN